ncbi:hypothetical protein Ccr5_gp189c [Caulobacter phage Ccr5]|nr:hypothetical protein Ccr5_gp189c [Caulobacter phage Ccr5]
MAEPGGPELMAMALRLAPKMLGTTIDVQDAVDNAGFPFGYFDAPDAFFTFLDRKVWKCEVCDHWCDPSELQDEVCLSCR